MHNFSIDIEMISWNCKVNRTSSCEVSNSLIALLLLQMKEGAQVEEQITKSAEVMVEVEHAISKFEPFSLICKQLLILFAGMRDQIDFLCEFTAQSFMSMLQCVLKSNTIDGSAEEGQRLALLKTQLYQEVASRVGRVLRAEDK